MQVSFHKDYNKSLHIKASHIFKERLQHTFSNLKSFHSFFYLIFNLFLKLFPFITILSPTIYNSRSFNHNPKNNPFDFYLFMTTLLPSRFLAFLLPQKGKPMLACS
jgi:hypothetical protein